MQAIVKIYCAQNNAYLGETTVDTADLPEVVQARLNKLILAHRSECPYYQTEGQRMNERSKKRR